MNSHTYIMQAKKVIKKLAYAFRKEHIDSGSIVKRNERKQNRSNNRSKNMDELRTKLENLKADLEFVRYSGALKEVEAYLVNEIGTINGALVACTAFDSAYNRMFGQRL